MSLGVSFTLAISRAPRSAGAAGGRSSGSAPPSTPPLPPARRKSPLPPCQLRGSRYARRHVRELASTLRFLNVGESVGQAEPRRVFLTLAIRRGTISAPPSSPPMRNVAHGRVTGSRRFG